MYLLVFWQMNGVDGDATFSVLDYRYNRVVWYAGPRPLGLGKALMLRGIRGGVVILDTFGEQLYKPVNGRLAGDDYVCETLNTLWSLGDRCGYIAEEHKRGGERHPCPGYSGLRCHTGEHLFTKRDVLRLYLRHRLRLRLVLAQSRVSFLFYLEDLVVYGLFHGLFLFCRGGSIRWSGFIRGTFRVHPY